VIRRKALKNIGLLTGGILAYPYSCNLIEEISYSNFPSIKNNQQKLIESICNLILPEDSTNFPTLDPRGYFVLTMCNDCLEKSEREKFLYGFELFQKELSTLKKIEFDKLTKKEQYRFVNYAIENKKSDASTFLNYLKSFSMLHFETSENYMKNYLNFEFMPGRYLGKVSI
tara:strand:+ start:174 stop:686 length:513 start_codon:yes stop_codon:yes gene_type:complete